MRFNPYIILIILNVIMVGLSTYLSITNFMAGTTVGYVCGSLWIFAAVCWIGCTVLNSINAVRKR